MIFEFNEEGKPYRLIIQRFDLTTEDPTPVEVTHHDLNIVRHLMHLREDAIKVEGVEVRMLDFYT
jgi:hypothetical protein